MLDRLSPLLRWVCLLLAAVIVFQIVRLVRPRDPADDRLSPMTATSLGAWADSPPGRTTNSGPGGAMSSDLPPTIQARIQQVVESETLGPIIRPLPMALLGIAGRDVILRAPNGQMGLLHEGEELGGVKLIRIGTNRVLIEHQGRKSELTVFSGFGSESLLPPASKTSP